MKKIIANLSYIILVLFIFTALLPAQNINTKNALDAYKNFYHWKEKENFSSSEDTVLSVIGRWAWGPCNAVDVKGNYAFIGNGPTFHVLDISEPSQPKIAGEYLTGYIYDIKIKENYAFVCIGSRLLILDISNPTQPQKVSDIIIATNDLVINAAIGNSFAYVTTFNGLVWAVDISDISNPYKRGVMNAGGQLVRCVETKDEYVYVGNPEFPPMYIIDAHNPDSLTRADFEVGGWGLCADIKDTVLLIGVHGYYGTNYLKIYNVSNTAEPSFLGELGIAAPDDIMAVTVSEDRLTAYMRTSSGIMYAVDISDLTQPKIMSNYKRDIEASVGNTGIAISNNSLFAAYFNGLLMLDISKPDSLKLQSFFPTGGLSERIQIKDTIAFVASGLSGLWIIDVSDPEKPTPVSNVITGGFTADLVIEDTIAYIVNWAAYSEQDTSRGLWIINISDIYKPIVIAHYIGITNFSYNIIPNSITKSKNLIFLTQSLTANNNILEAINVSNPYQPSRKWIFKGGFLAYDVAVKDTIAYLATYANGIKIINITNPENLVEVNSILNDAFSVTIKGETLYVSTADFTIINISDPYNPSIISSINTHYGSSNVDLMISDNYVYWAEGSLGVIDISNPENPIQMATFAGNDWGSGVVSKDDKIFFVDKSVGMWILKNNLITSVNEPHVELPISYNLSQNYPNPFNPSTTIEFEIPQKEKVVIEIFNTLGQKVKTLLNKEMEQGKHKVNFNALGLSSGIYFYRLSAGRNSVTKKMVILR